MLAFLLFYTLGGPNYAPTACLDLYNMFQTLLFAVIITALILWLAVKKILSKRKVQHLHTKYVLITGCDTGFGRETAIRLDKIGVHTLATCLTVDAAQELKSMTSDRLRTFLVDVTDSSQIKGVCEQVKKLLPSGQGKINGLFGSR